MKNLYSKKFMKVISIFAIIATTLIAIKIGFIIWKFTKIFDEHTVSPTKLLIKNYILLSGNIVFLCLHIFLIFNPQRFIIIGFASLFYSICYLLSSIQLQCMSIPMLALSVVTFSIYGFFYRKRKLKIIVFTLFYIVCLILPIFSDIKFIECIISKITISFVMLLFLFFFSEYIKQLNKKQTTTKILNLADFKGIVRSDMFLLQEILDNKKYKEIALKIHGNEGALRNKLSKIYKILGVGDRIGFITIYSGYELIFEPEGEKKK